MSPAWRLRVAVARAASTARKMISPPQPRLLHLHLDGLADEAPEILRLDQRPVNPGRGHLQGVLPRQRVLDIQQRRPLPAPPGAVVHVHAPGTVYIYPQRRVGV